MSEKKVFIGWDSKEPIAYDVCKFSIRRHSNVPVIPLKQSSLRSLGLYNREDVKASTEFSLTRFLTPFLSVFDGYSIFCDCDFLWLKNVEEVFAFANPDHAVSVVKHNYVPTSSTKMGGKIQELYPKKNWSSLILWNNEHPKNTILTPEYINSVEPSTLHQFKWLEDNEIGEIPLQWNWLSGWYKEPEDGTPKAIHYTEGGPWMSSCENVPYAGIWMDEKRAMVYAKTDGF